MKPTNGGQSNEAKAAFSGGAAPRVVDLSGVAHSGDTIENPGLVTRGLTRSWPASVRLKATYIPNMPNL